jgi:hypothetical protein
MAIGSGAQSRTPFSFSLLPQLSGSTPLELHNDTTATNTAVTNATTTSTTTTTTTTGIIVDTNGTSINNSNSSIVGTETMTEESGVNSSNSSIVGNETMTEGFGVNNNSDINANECEDPQGVLQDLLSSFTITWPAKADNTTAEDDISSITNTPSTRAIQTLLDHVEAGEWNPCNNTPDQVTQRYALLVWYQSTQGPLGWIQSRHWASNHSECEWYGVTCNNRHQVTALTLGMYIISNRPMMSIRTHCFQHHLTYFYCFSSTDVINLQGTIPSELQGLSHLQRFQVYNNALSGTLPTDVWSYWPNLQLVDIESNVLQGTIPTEGLEQLTDLQTWRVSGNQFVGTLPATLAGATALRELWAGQNDLEGSIPAEWEALTNIGTCNDGGYT